MGEEIEELLVRAEALNEALEAAIKRPGHPDLEELAKERQEVSAQLMAAFQRVVVAGLDAGSVETDQAAMALRMRRLDEVNRGFLAIAQKLAGAASKVGGAPRQRRPRREGGARERRGVAKRYGVGACGWSPRWP